MKRTARIASLVYAHRGGLFSISFLASFDGLLPQLFSFG